MVCQVPAWGEKQRQQHHSRHHQTIAGGGGEGGGGAVLFPVYPLFQPVADLPGHVTSLLKGSPLTGPGQDKGAESGLCRQTACVSTPTLSLTSWENSHEGLNLPESVFAQLGNRDDKVYASQGVVVKTKQVSVKCSRMAPSTW